MPTLTKLYSMAEAAEHNTKDDCWVVIDGKVYDVSLYLDEHPGGGDVIQAVTGKDATDDFEDVGHSKSARKIMEKFFIGELDPSSGPTIPKLEIVAKQSSSSYITQKVMDFTKQYWVLPATIVGISVVASCVFLHKK
ncbi:unnamed protein product [Cuscuta europaea]|uniref:Cytochrome b5 heme-binding domain-containing protein n=1 Tax=Cuscuta europaea TaxID=41803 RepID=A0A9P1EL65_CUSEU|nr:unnamed protein product [Cuscuta europaea]